MGFESLTSDPQRSTGSERWKDGPQAQRGEMTKIPHRTKTPAQDSVLRVNMYYSLHQGWPQASLPPQFLPRAQNSGPCALSSLWWQAGGNDMRLWLRGLVLQALRSTRGVCGSCGQPPPLPVPQKIVATWEAINLGRQPVPEYFNFARDVLDVWTQLEKVKPTVS